MVRKRMQSSQAPVAWLAKMILKEIVQSTAW